MNPLLELADRVETATGPDRMLDRDIAIEAIGWPKAALTGNPTPEYTASLDAAMTLVPEGWQRAIGDWATHGNDEDDVQTGVCWTATLERFDRPGEVRSDAVTAPLALTAASLRAIASMGSSG